MMRQNSGQLFRRFIAWGLGLMILVIAAVYGERAMFVEADGPVKLVVYAFSTQEEVLTQSIFPAFEQTWEAETRRDLTIEGVFGPSGTLAGQINLGAPADVALLSNEQHINWLVMGRQVKPTTVPVFVSQTPMVIVTRPGNPAHLTTFADLARPGLNLLHPDPRTSGAGDWALLAEYGSNLLETNNPAAAQTQLLNIWQNVRLLGPSARTTLTLFELGAGDAMITYEQDARLAQARGVALEIITPAYTIMAQHPAVIIDANVTASERAAAQALLDYLVSADGQQVVAQYHLRPIDPALNHFPALPHVFTAADLGGWSKAYLELVEVLWQNQIEPRLKLEPAVKLIQPGGE